MTEQDIRASYDRDRRSETMSRAKVVLQVAGLVAVIAGSLVAVRQCDPETPLEPGVRQTKQAVQCTDHNADSSLCNTWGAVGERWLAKRVNYEDLRKIIRQKLGIIYLLPHFSGDRKLSIINLVYRIFCIPRGLSRFYYWEINAYIGAKKALVKPLGQQVYNSLNYYERKPREEHQEMGYEVKWAWSVFVGLGMGMFSKPERHFVPFPVQLQSFFAKALHFLKNAYLCFSRRASVCCEMVGRVDGTPCAW